MSKNRKSGPQKPGSSFLVNLRAGDYNLVERATKVIGNVGRKLTRVQPCCGNYGDPGC